MGDPTLRTDLGRAWNQLSETEQEVIALVALLQTRRRKTAAVPAAA